MIEGILNRLAVTGMDCARWPSSENYGNGPDILDLYFGTITQDLKLYSRPIPIHGMELTTFQAVYLPDLNHSDLSMTLHFQVSQDGEDWDDVPDWEFSIDPSTMILSWDHQSYTYEVIANEAYIRIVVSPVTEGGPAIGDHLRVYVTTKET